MSAWDIAGLIGWGFLLWFSILGILYAAKSNVALADSDGVSLCAITFLPGLCGTAFCIARLCGAHA